MDQTETVQWLSSLQDDMVLHQMFISFYKDVRDAANAFIIMHHDLRIRVLYALHKHHPDAAGYLMQLEGALFTKKEFGLSAMINKYKMATAFETAITECDKIGLQSIVDAEPDIEKWITPDILANVINNGDGDILKIILSVSGFIPSISMLLRLSKSQEMNALLKDHQRNYTGHTIIDLVEGDDGDDAVPVKKEKNTSAKSKKRTVSSYDDDVIIVVNDDKQEKQLENPRSAKKKAATAVDKDTQTDVLNIQMTRLREYLQGLQRESDEYTFTTDIPKSGRSKHRSILRLAALHLDDYVLPPGLLNSLDGQPTEVLNTMLDAVESDELQIYNFAILYAYHAGYRRSSNPDYISQVDMDAIMRRLPVIQLSRTKDLLPRVIATIVKEDAPPKDKEEADALPESEPKRVRQAPTPVGGTMAATKWPGLRQEKFTIESASGVPNMGDTAKLVMAIQLNSGKPGKDKSAVLREFKLYGGTAKKPVPFYKPDEMSNNYLEYFEYIKADVLPRLVKRNQLVEEAVRVANDPAVLFTEDELNAIDLGVGYVYDMYTKTTTENDRIKKMLLVAFIKFYATLIRNKGLFFAVIDALFPGDVIVPVPQQQQPQQQPPQPPQQPPQQPVTLQSIITQVRRENRQGLTALLHQQLREGPRVTSDDAAEWLNRNGYTTATYFNSVASKIGPSNTARINFILKHVLPFQIALVNMKNDLLGVYDTQKNAMEYDQSFISGLDNHKVVVLEQKVTELVKTTALTPSQYNTLLLIMAYKGERLNPRVNILIDKGTPDEKYLAEAAVEKVEAYKLGQLIPATSTEDIVIDAMKYERGNIGLIPKNTDEMQQEFILFCETLRTVIDLNNTHIDILRTAVGKIRDFAKDKEEWRLVLEQCADVDGGEK